MNHNINEKDKQLSDLSKEIVNILIAYTKESKMNWTSIENFMEQETTEAETFDDYIFFKLLDGYRLDVNFSYYTYINNVMYFCLKFSHYGKKESLNIIAALHPEGEEVRELPTTDNELLLRLSNLIRFSLLPPVDSSKTQDLNFLKYIFESLNDD